MIKIPILSHELILQLKIQGDYLFHISVNVYFWDIWNFP